VEVSQYILNDPGKWSTLCSGKELAEADEREAGWGPTAYLDLSEHKTKPRSLVTILTELSQSRICHSRPTSQILHLFEARHLLLHLQETATGPYLKPAESSPLIYILFLSFYLMFLISGNLPEFMYNVYVAWFLTLNGLLHILIFRALVLRVDYLQLLGKCTSYYHLYQEHVTVAYRSMDVLWKELSGLLQAPPHTCCLQAE
jgi:hypothetical protein